VDQKRTSTGQIKQSHKVNRVVKSVKQSKESCHFVTTGQN